jgi:hypothetical protein
VRAVSAARCSARRRSGATDRPTASRAMRKLEIHTRREAAAQTQKLGLAEPTYGEAAPKIGSAPDACASARP